jgi:hypothetical protein
MTSFRQIEANRRNAQLSTGPVTEEGKRRSRQNAVRHGLTAETVIDALEDAEDYAAFEMAITADYDAQSAVERELVLRLQACYGGCVARPRSRVGCSRSRPNSCFSSDSNGRPIKNAKISSAACTETPSRPRTTRRRMRLTPPALSMSAHNRPWSRLTNSTRSRAPLSAFQTCRPIRSIG